MIAFHRSASVGRLLEGALQRLTQSTHPSVRQGDQEMLWFEWTSRSHSDIRMLALPEEVYCPLESRQPPKPEFLRKSRWHTSWRRGTYNCAAVHGHAYVEMLRVHLAAQNTNLSATCPARARSTRRR